MHAVLTVGSTSGTLHDLAITYACTSASGSTTGTWHDLCSNLCVQLCQWVYDWHIHRFGLTKLAEINLADLIKSVQTCWKENSKVAHFGQLTAVIQSRNLLRW